MTSTLQFIQSQYIQVKMYYIINIKTCSNFFLKDKNKKKRLKLICM